MVSCLKYDKDDIKIILNNYNGLPFLSVITFHLLILIFNIETLDKSTLIDLTECKTCIKEN